MTGPTLSAQCSSVDPQNPAPEQQSELTAHIPFPVSPPPHVPCTIGDGADAGCAAAPGTSIPSASNRGVVAPAAAADGGGAGPNVVVVVAAAAASRSGGSTNGPRLPTFPAQCSAVVPQYPYIEQHSELSGHMAFPTDPPPHVPWREGADPTVDGGATADEEGDDAPPPLRRAVLGIGPAVPVGGAAVGGIPARAGADAAVAASRAAAGGCGILLLHRGDDDCGYWQRCSDAL